MNKAAQTTAKLVFTGEQFVALPKVADIVGTAMMQQTGSQAAISDTSLTAIKVTCADRAVMIDLAFEGNDTFLTVALSDDTVDQAALLMALARVTYALATTLPIVSVVWAGTDLRIPRQTFVDGLAAQLGQTSATVTPITPRRVACTKATSRPVAAPVSQVLPQVSRLAHLPSANQNTALGSVAFDAHVKLYESRLRDTLLRDADATELSQMRAGAGGIPIEARLSTWAVSLAVATVALPVAAPVLVYNIVRGEDMRVASLAMGLAGLFLALDSSGAMAGVPGF